MKKKNALDTSVRKWSPPLKGTFLEALRSARFVTQACDLVNVPRSTVYRWREDDRVFKDAMDEAELRFADDLRSEAFKRAMGDEGRNRSDEILKVLLKAKVPEFQEKGASTIQISFVQLVVGKIQGIIQRFVPITCPHCGEKLDARKNMAQELGRLDAIDITAVATAQE